MYTSIKTLAAAIALPLVAALPLSQRTEAVFDSTKPFTLHTEVVNGTGAFHGQYLSSFHVGAGQSTIVGSKNSSIAVGWSKFDQICFVRRLCTNAKQLSQTQSCSSLWQSAVLLPASPTTSVFSSKLPSALMLPLATTTST